MAKKFEILGQSLVITDESIPKVLFDFPKGEVYYDSALLINDGIIKINNIDALDNAVASAPRILLSDAIDGTDTPFTESTFIAFARTNLGFKTASGGSGAGVEDTAYSISWNGVSTIAPSKNALYDFIESQVFKVDASSNIIPIFWGGTQAEYDIDFPTGHDPEYFIVITDGAVSPTSASDIVNVPSGNLVATDVQGALDELQTEVDANTLKTGITAQQAADITTNNAKVGVTTEEANTIDSEPIGNESQVLQVVSISQANYDLITPVATTLYVING